jgi:CheY-like chemotaxis protein
MSDSTDILIIDDDEVDFELIVRSIKTKGIKNKVKHARDGVEGLALLSEYQACNSSAFIVILDLNMPKLNGFEFLEKVRSNESLKKAVIFVFSTSDAESDVERAFFYNVAGYFVKPATGAKNEYITDFLKDYLQISQFPGSYP